MASITKLMTAYAASKSYTATTTITLSPETLVGKGRSGLYQAGTALSFESALEALLISSHDEVADALALASESGTDTFISRMNIYAKLLKLSDTAYVNPSGLDPDSPVAPANHSSAHDIYRLLREIQENEPKLFVVTTQKNVELFDTENTKIASLTNTNPLLGEAIGSLRVIGGKTGQTPRAKQALVVAASTSCGGIVYAVVLRSDDRAADMRALLTYGAQGFNWDCTTK
jgi:D-alanyl-D-alanine carboxypeptidase